MHLDLSPESLSRINESLDEELSKIFQNANLNRSQRSIVELEDEIARLRFQVRLMKTMDEETVRISHEQAGAARDMAALWRQMSLEHQRWNLQSDVIHLSIPGELVSMMKRAVSTFQAQELGSQQGTAEVVLSMMKMLEDLEKA